MKAVLTQNLQNIEPSFCLLGQSTVDAQNFIIYDSQTSAAVRWTQNNMEGQRRLRFYDYYKAKSYP